MTHTHDELQAVKPTRQEQEQADELVTEIAEGIYRLQLPVSMPGLGHVNCYALEDEHGFALIDPGLPSEESWAALRSRLDQLDANVKNVHTAVVTHSHPDHYGGVHRLQADHEIKVITHHDFSSAYAPPDSSEYFEDPDITALDLADDEDIEKFRNHMRRTNPWGTEREPPSPDQIRVWGATGLGINSKIFRPPEANWMVGDLEEVSLGKRSWLAVHTPGHTHDHLCLYSPNDGLFLSGDHVLPTITPHIGGITTLQDPLATFIESLKRMHEFSNVSKVLPAHGHPFVDLTGRAESIIEHHADRLDSIREAGDELGAASVETYMKRLFKQRSWGDMAASETYAHLLHLRFLGEASEEESQGIKIYQIN